MIDKTATRRDILFYTIISKIKYGTIKKKNINNLYRPIPP